MLLREMEGDDFGVRGVGDGFADAEEKAEREQYGEGMGDAGKGGGSGPQGETGGEDPVDVEAVHEPTGEKLTPRIGGEKSGQKKTELGWRDVEFLFEHWRGDGEAATVDVVEDDGDSEKK